MSCRRARKLIYNFIDGNITDQDRLSLEQHLGVCGPCEKMAAGLSRSLDLLHRLAPEELDENFTWKVRLRLARERNAIAKGSESHRGWIRSWNTRFAFSALSALVVVVAVGYFSFGPGSGPSGVPVDDVALSDAPASVGSPKEESTGFLASPMLKNSASEQVAKRTDESGRANRARRVGPYGMFTPQTVALGASAAPAGNEGALKQDTSSDLLATKELKVSDEKRAEQLERVILDLRRRLEACGCEDH